MQVPNRWEHSPTPQNLKMLQVKNKKQGYPWRSGGYSNKKPNKENPNHFAGVSKMVLCLRFSELLSYG
jgi:hypothetical protein